MKGLHWLDITVLVGAVLLLISTAFWCVLAIGITGQVIHGGWYWFRRTLLGAIVAEKLGLRSLQDLPPEGDSRYSPPKDVN